MEISSYKAYLKQHTFIDEAILVMKLSGDVKSLPFLLLNETLITYKGPVKYLEKVAAKELNYTLAGSFFLGGSSASIVNCSPRLF